MKKVYIHHMAVVCSMFFCAVVSLKAEQPDYLTRPLPEHWDYSDDIMSDLPSSDRWWNQFGDTLLNKFVGIAIDNNFDLKVAMRRMELAQNAIKSARASYFPSIGLNAGWSKDQSSGMTGYVGGRPSTESYFNAGLSAQWEIDLFGKIASEVNQKKGLYRASRADYTSAMVSLCGQVAKSYVQVRVWQEQLRIADRHSQSQQRVLAMTEARKKAGLASDLDVSQAKVVLGATQAQVPVLDAMVQNGIHSLATLLGLYPDEISTLIEQNKCAIPDYRQIVACGLPAQLIQRRPDIIAAQQQLSADAAAIGIARKDFLPDIQLNGSIGTQAHNGKDLFTRNSYFYGFGASLSWTLFDGLARKYNLSDAKIQFQQDVDQYNLTVMNAIQEVDAAINSYTGELKHIDRIEEVVEDSDRSFSLSLDLYKEGLSSFTNVVDAQLNTFTYQNELVQAKGSALVDLIELYVALGGGW